jgi:hypothetical protein
LEKDDCLDAVSMSQFVLRGRLSKAGPAAANKTLFERLRDGDFVENGFHIGEGLDINQLTAEQVNEILDARTPNPRPTGRTKI